MKRRPAIVPYYLGSRTRYKNVPIKAMKKKLIQPCQSRKFLQFRLLNSHFINNKACHIYYLIVGSKFNIWFLAETWHIGDVSPAFKAATSKTHQFYHVMRPVTGLGNPGGGVGVITSRHIPNMQFSCRKFSTFECMCIQFNYSNDKFRAFYKWCFSWFWEFTNRITDVW